MFVVVRLSVECKIHIYAGKQQFWNAHQQSLWSKRCENLDLFVFFSVFHHDLAFQQNNSCNQYEEHRYLIDENDSVKTPIVHSCNV